MMRTSRPRPSKISEYQRTRALKLLSEEVEATDIAEMLGITVSSIYRIVKNQKAERKAAGVNNGTQGK